MQEVSLTAIEWNFHIESMENMQCMQSERIPANDRCLSNGSEGKDFETILSGQGQMRLCISLWLAIGARVLLALSDSRFKMIDEAA
ncbi:hypothetical protein AbraIFM66950_005472 [Aspergillus brasiliensis]|nr:hypothetical protein AbraIFM66950_005472 [Aspergillus brasiliensis]